MRLDNVLCGRCQCPMTLVFQPSPDGATTVVLSCEDCGYSETVTDE